MPDRARPGKGGLEHREPLHRREARGAAAARTRKTGNQAAVIRILRAHAEGAVIGHPLLVASAFLPIFPVTLAYVIVVERAMDVGVVLRQGLQHALARKARSSSFSASSCSWAR